MSGSIQASDDVEVTSYGSMSGFTATTTTASSQLNVFASGGLNATLTSGNELSATSLGAVQGTYNSGTTVGFTDGSATVNGKSSINATISAAPVPYSDLCPRVLHRARSQPFAVG